MNLQFRAFADLKKFKVMLPQVALRLDTNSGCGLDYDTFKELIEAKGWLIDRDNDKFVSAEDEIDTYEAGYHENEDGEYVWIDNAGVMIATGITDQRGTMIFLDDIIEDNHTHRWKVIFQDGCFWLWRKDFSSANDMRSWPENCYPMFRVDHSRYSKVIGNIHENPDLL